MRIRPRAEWGARLPKSRVGLPADRVTHLFLHHAAGVYPSGPEAMRRIQRFHQDTRGWADYAYSFGVWDDGSIWEGRGWGAQGGHTKGWNSRSVAVCYMGDGTKPVPQAALDAISWVAGEADRHFGRPLIRLSHREVGVTACPGDWLHRWWASESVRAPQVPSEGWVAEKPEVLSPTITERAVDSWAGRPSWVPKADWQRLIDWTRGK